MSSIDAVGTAFGLRLITIVAAAVIAVHLVTYMQMPPLSSWNELDSGRPTPISRPLSNRSIHEGPRDICNFGGGNASAHSSIDRLQRMGSTQKTRLDEVMKTLDTLCAECDTLLRIAGLQAVGKTRNPNGVVDPLLFSLAKTD